MALGTGSPEFEFQLCGLYHPPHQWPNPSGQRNSLSVQAAIDLTSRHGPESHKSLHFLAHPRGGCVASPTHCVLTPKDILLCEPHSPQSSQKQHLPTPENSSFRLWGFCLLFHLFIYF